MYLLYAPPSKFGRIPPGTAVISDEVKFYMNVAFCQKNYWHKVHTQNGFTDISPRYFKKLRSKRQLHTVLIFATGGIGDSLWSMPLARYIYENNPGCNIAVVVEKRNAAVWRNCPFITATVENSVWNVQNLIAKSDDVFDIGGVATALKEYQKLDPIEASFRMAGFKLPCERQACRPLLTITIDEGKRAEAILKQNNVNSKKDSIICISIESSTPNRNWPFQYNLDLTKALISKGHKVIWLGESKRYADTFIDEASKKIGAVNLISKTSIRECMALIAISDLFVGPNSCLMVIATALNIPSIGLFGAFNPKTRTKFYDRFTPLWGKAPCAPCDEHWTECRHGYPAPCMKMILPSQVFTEAEKLLKKYPRTLLEKLPID
jgi:ADP-heptose:LPS heptosyltransferase